MIHIGQRPGWIRLDLRFRTEDALPLGMLTGIVEQLLRYRLGFIDAAELRQRGRPPCNTMMLNDKVAAN